MPCITFLHAGLKMVSTRFNCLHIHPSLPPSIHSSLLLVAHVYDKELCFLYAWHTIMQEWLQTRSSSHISRHVIMQASKKVWPLNVFTTSFLQCMGTSFLQYYRQHPVWLNLLEDHMLQEEHHMDLFQCRPAQKSPRFSRSHSSWRKEKNGYLLKERSNPARFEKETKEIQYKYSIHKTFEKQNDKNGSWKWSKDDNHRLCISHTQKNPRQSNFCTIYPCHCSQTYVDLLMLHIHYLSKLS